MSGFPRDIGKQVSYMVGVIFGIHTLPCMGTALIVVQMAFEINQLQYTSIQLSYPRIAPAINSNYSSACMTLRIRPKATDHTKMQSIDSTFVVSLASRPSCRIM